MAYWIDTGTGTSTDPGTTAVISAVRQYATEGGIGVPPTIPGAEWFNMITDEVLAVLDLAGISPDKASHTQLRDAIKLVVVSAAATQAEVNESNPVNQRADKFVTPKTLWGWTKQATETVLGMMKVATQTQTNAGTADDVAVTPKKLRSGFSASMGANGYIALPVWMGSLILQWGRALSGAGGGVTVTFPVSHPLSGTDTKVFLTHDAPGTQSRSLNTTTIGASTFSCYLSSGGVGVTGGTINWFSIGY